MVTGKGQSNEAISCSLKAGGTTVVDPVEFFFLVSVSSLVFLFLKYEKKSKSVIKLDSLQSFFPFLNS